MDGWSTAEKGAYVTLDGRTRADDHERRCDMNANVDEMICVPLGDGCLPLDGI